MFRKIRKSQVEKEEVIADVVFLTLGFILADASILIFDLHWNFYQAGDLLTKQIFQNKLIYLWGGSRRDCMPFADKTIPGWPEGRGDVVVQENKEEIGNS